MAENIETKRRVCYHPRCPYGVQAYKRCDELRAAGCVWRMSKEAADLVQKLWRQQDRRREGHSLRRACPACREQTVWVRYHGKYMELCTACASLWYNRKPYDWRGETDG